MKKKCNEDALDNRRNQVYNLINRLINKMSFVVDMGSGLTHMARTPKVVEDRREQILDAAMRVFAQKGFVRATNKDIAREAGITAGLIYHYFESKEALLVAVIEGRSPLKILSALPANAFAMPPELFFPSMIQQILRVVETENFIALIRVVLPELLNNEHSFLAQVVPIALQRGLNFLGEYLEAQMQAGTLRQKNVVLTTQMLFGSIVGIVLRRQVLRDPTALELTHEQIAATITETLMHGLAPS